MVVTDYHKKRTMGNVQKEGTMKFPTRWFCKQSCESGSCDRISTYRSRKEKKNVGQVPRNVTIWADRHSDPTLRAYDTLGATWEDIDNDMLIGIPDRHP